MKRTTRSAALSIGLAGLLALAGCGSSSNNNADTTAGSSLAGVTCPLNKFKDADGRTEVVLWFQVSGKAADTLKKLVDKYNASQDKVTVRAESQGSSYEELLAAFTRGIPTNQLPDIYVGEETNQRFLVDSGKLFPAQACFDADKISTDQFSKTAVSYYSVNNVLYPASASISDLLTYYNKNHFRKAGLSADQVPKTLDEVRAVAQTIKDKGVISTPPVVLKMDSWFVETQLTGDRQAVVDNDNGSGSGKTTKATFDTESTRKLYTWVRDMVRDGLLRAVPATDGQLDHYLLMAKQEASISMETSTASTTIAAFLSGDQGAGDQIGINTNSIDLDKLDIGAGPVFGVTSPGRAQIGGNGFYLTNTNGDSKISAAWDFMKWWNQPEQQVTWHVEGSYLPFLTAAVDDPQVRTFWETDPAGKMLKIAYDEMNQGIYPDFTGPKIGPFDKFRAAIREGLDTVAFTDGDPDTTVADAVKKVDAALTEYNDATFK